MKVVILVQNDSVQLPDWVTGKLGPYSTSGSALLYYARIDPARLEELRRTPGVVSASQEKVSGGACGGACSIG
jgi:hypothetical protein